MAMTSEKILHKIREKNIVPLPRWRFVAKNGIILFLFFVSLLLGALAFSVTLDLLLNNDWDIYLHLGRSFARHILGSIPYFWLIIFFFFIWFAFYDFTHIKGWYRYRIHAVIFTCILSGFIAGMLFLLSGIGNQMDQIFSNVFPFYHLISLDKKGIWCRPHNGLLGGEVTSLEAENSGIKVKDCNGSEWLVDMAMLHPEVLRIKVGEKIKIIGREISEKIFEAKEFRRW